MLSLSYWPVNPCFPPQEGGKMEGVLFNLMVEGRLQGTLVPLVSRAMPPPPGWSVPCWQCEPIPSLYNLWSSLFLWIWSEPVFSPFPRGFIALGLCWLCGTPPPRSSCHSHCWELTHSFLPCLWWPAIKNSTDALWLLLILAPPHRNQGWLRKAQL